MIKRFIILLFLALCIPVFAQRKITTNEAIKFSVGPFFDSTDGITPETGITVTALTVEIYREFDADTTPTRFANFVPTTSGGGVNDMVLVGSSVSGVYSLEVTAAQLNFTGSMMLTIVDTDNAGIVGLPFWRYFTLTSANVVDAEYGTDYLQTDTKQLDGSGIQQTSGHIHAFDDAGAALSTLTTSDNIGINWGDVSNPTTSVGLSGTTVGTVSAATLADTDHTINSLTIDDDTGTAFTIITRGGNGHAMSLQGHGTGEGFKTTGGATGHGFDAQGGASGGQGINAKANGGNGAGMLLQGVGTGEGLDARGGTTGHGISGLGGASSGAGIYGRAQANNDAGMELVKHGTGDDFDADTIADDTSAILIDTGAQDTSTELRELLLGSTPAGNFLDMYDGTGYAGGTAVFQADITKVAGDAVTDNNDGRLEVNVEELADSAIQQESGYIKISDGTGTGQIQLTSGAVDVVTIETVDATDKIADAVWDETLTGNNHSGANSAGKRLRQIEHASVLREEEQAQGATSSTITLHNDASSINGFYDDAEVVIVGDTGIGQSRHIHAYVGNSRIASVTPDWVTTPNATSDYVIMADSEKHVHEIDDGGITAAVIATGALDADAFNLDAWHELIERLFLQDATATYGDESGSVVDQIADSASGTGTTPALVWAYGTKALTDKSGFSLAADQSAVTIGTVTTLTGHTVQTGDSYAKVNSASYGLSALYDILTNGTYGLSALRTRGDAAWTTGTGTATSGNQTTILGRLAAIMSKAASDPSIGTYNPATDSLEAQQESPQAPPIID